MSRIGTPQNQRSRDTRAAVLDAAWELLEQPGGAGVTMVAVAEAAGISRRGLYLHFPSRGALFEALLEHIDGSLGLEESLRPFLDAPDAVTALAEFAGHIARFQPRVVGPSRAVEHSRFDDPDAAALWARISASRYRGCILVSERLQREGQLASPWTATTAADLLWSMMSVEFVDALNGERGWTEAELAERLRIVMHRTLCEPQPGGD